MSELLDGVRYPTTDEGSILPNLGKLLATCCGEVFTSAAIIFSSTNTAWTAIRMALGSSV